MNNLKPTSPHSSLASVADAAFRVQPLESGSGTGTQESWKWWGQNFRLNLSWATQSFQSSKFSEISWHKSGQRSAEYIWMAYTLDASGTIDSSQLLLRYSLLKVWYENEWKWMKMNENEVSNLESDHIMSCNYSFISFRQRSTFLMYPNVT